MKEEVIKQLEDMREKSDTCTHNFEYGKFTIELGSMYLKVCKECFIIEGVVKNS